MEESKPAPAQREPATPILRKEDKQWIRGLFLGFFQLIFFFFLTVGIVDFLSIAFLSSAGEPIERPVPQRTAPQEAAP